MPLRNNNLAPSNATLTHILVDSVVNSEPRGQFIIPSLQACGEFRGVVDLISKMDAFFDRQGFPQAYNQYRSIVSTTTDNNSATQGVFSSVTEEITSTIRGEKATFVIQVLYRQNSTWQGSITWVEKNMSQRFRSTLEMIKCMDSVLSSEEDFSNQARWEGHEEIRV